MGKSRETSVRTALATNGTRQRSKSAPAPRARIRFRATILLPFFRQSLKVIRNLNRKRSAMEARNMDLNVATTDNTRYRNHAKEEEADLNRAFLALSYAW